MNLSSLAGAIRLGVIALASAFFVALPVQADPTFPDLGGQRVVDDAHILPAQTQADLTQKSADLEARTGDQLVVVTVPSLQGDSIEDYGYKLGRKWGIGQKEKNNGVLFIVAPNDRKVRIEVGYGLEDVLTDALSSVILQEKVLPKFRQGDYPGGTTAGVDSVIQQLTLDKPQAVANAQAAAQQQRQPHGLPLGAIIALVIIFLVISRVLRTGLWPLLFLGGGWRSGGWSDGGGGGWGGGGGGGFSGGGGSFGGGGASGGW